MSSLLYLEVSLRSPGEGKGYPLQYSGLENSMDWLYSPWDREELNTIEQLSLTVKPMMLNFQNSIWGPGRDAGSWSLGEGNGTPLQYSCLENPMDGGAW